MSSVMEFRVRPGAAIGGQVVVPGDKSISHRALMLGAIAEGDTQVQGFLQGEDCFATMSALGAMGVAIELQDTGDVLIHGVGPHGLRAPQQTLDMGNSGTGLRLMMGLLAGQSFSVRLSGDESLIKRPMERVAEPLRRMGAVINTTSGAAPVDIRGSRLSGLDFDSPVASAQVKSAVLLAGLYAQGRTSVREPGVTRDHTERMLQSFGVELEQSSQCCTITGPVALTGTTVRVPGDLSSAAFALAAGCVSVEGTVQVDEVGVNPTRTGVLEILRLMGANIVSQNSAEFGAEPVASLIATASTLKGSTIPAKLVPLAIDEFPLVFALAALAEGETCITGAEELRAKESDRIAVMLTGLKSLGVDAEELPDGAIIRGGAVAGGTVDSCGDHRVAMAFAILGARATGEVRILNTANVRTSFPGFVKTMRNLGLDVLERES
jgi:3-phosphoshikimate 1-carboxyvinyltransferase